MMRLLELCAAVGFGVAAAGRWPRRRLSFAGQRSDAAHAGPATVHLRDGRVPAAQPNGASQPVAGTNNEAERTLRSAGRGRKTGRTSKTLVGARRQTIIVSVLESLRLYLPKFTLASVIEEINRWWQAGQSCFTKLLNKMNLQPRTESILDKVMPIPDG